MMLATPTKNFSTDETFFLLPSLSCPIPLLTKSKLNGLLQSLVGAKLVDAEAVVQNKEGNLISATTNDLSFDGLYQFAHNMFSVAGLCSQVCTIGFQIDYVTVETETNSFLFIKEKDEKNVVSCVTQSISFED